jgi:hypothetical protein
LSFDINNKSQSYSAKEYLLRNHTVVDWSYNSVYTLFSSGTQTAIRSSQNANNMFLYAASAILSAHTNASSWIKNLLYQTSLEKCINPLSVNTYILSATSATDII